MSDIPPTRTQYSIRYSVSVSPDMDEKLKQILGKQDRRTSMNDLVRVALRQYIDDQEDVIGSRRHFSKSLQNRVDDLEGLVVFYLNILIFLFASSLAVLIQATTGDSKIQSISLIRTAIAASLKDGPQLSKQIQAVRSELAHHD